MLNKYKLMLLAHEDIEYGIQSKLDDLLAWKNDKVSLCW